MSGYEELRTQQYEHQAKYHQKARDARTNKLICELVDLGYSKQDSIKLCKAVSLINLYNRG